MIMLNRRIVPYFKVPRKGKKRNPTVEKELYRLNSELNNVRSIYICIYNRRRVWRYEEADAGAKEA